MMADDKVIELFKFYAALDPTTARSHDLKEFEPEKLPDSFYKLTFFSENGGAQIGLTAAVRHASWMAAEAIKFVEEAKSGMREPTASEWLRVNAGRSKREKAHRWLGFIQGVLWMAGCFTLDELKEHSRRCSDEPEKAETR